MIRLRDRRTGELFDRWSEIGTKRRVLLDRSWAGVFREHLLEELPVDTLAGGLTEGFGRPSKDLHVVVGVLLLQQLHDLTDAATVEALAFNLAWHYALDVRSEQDCYFCEKTLRNYRRQIIARGLDEALFSRLTDTLVRAFGVDTTSQRMDSTALRSAMRSLTRLGIIVETISKFIRAVAHTHPALYAKIDDGLIKLYVAREGDGCFASTMPSISRRRLGETGPDLLGLVVQFRETEAALLPEFTLLETVLQDQFEVTEGESGPEDRTALPRDPKTIPCDTICNPADPDASYNAHKGLGYVAQIVETFTQDDGKAAGKTSLAPDLITHVAVHKMTIHDGHRLPGALQDLSGRSLMPELLLGDSHYGGPDNMKLAESRAMKLVTPICAAKGKGQDRLTLEDFTLNEEGRVLHCPAGIAPVSTSLSKAKVQASFDLNTCRDCPDMLRCPMKAAEKAGDTGRFQYTPARIKTRIRRLYEQSSEFRDTYRWRAGVEATMSRLKHKMNLARIRVRGMPAMRYITHLRALGLNILRCAAFRKLGLTPHT